MSSGKSSRRSSISNILDAFNLSSRDTQNKVHRSWSQPSSDGEAPGPSNKRGPDPSDLEADASLNPSVHYEFTRKDPMGAIILSILGELTMLANKSNKAMSADIDDICEKFHNHQISEKQKINRRIMQTTADLERSMIEKELNSHALNQTVEAPMHFSPTPTLQTPRQTADCLKLLPSGSHKFSGTANSLSIVEYLYNLNQVQEQCNLSLDEFYKAMLASTTGAPYTYIMGAIKNNEDPANIYHNLLIRYDKRLQPEEAESDYTRIEFQGQRPWLRLKHTYMSWPPKPLAHFRKGQQGPSPVIMKKYRHYLGLCLRRVLPWYVIYIVIFLPG